MRTTFMIRTVEKDVSLPSGVALRGANYHLQIKVPVRLRQHFSGPFWIRTSLGTGDKSAAAALAHRYWAEASEAFAQAEAKTKIVAAVQPTAAMLSRLHERVRRAILSGDATRRLALKGTAPSVIDMTLQAGTLPEDRFERLEAIKWIEAAVLKGFGMTMAMGVPVLGKMAADTEAAQLGLAIDWTGRDDALMALTETAIQAYSDAARRTHGEPIPTPESPLPIDPPGVAGKLAKPKDLQEAFDAWKVGKKPDAVNKTKRAMALVQAAGVTTTLRDLTRQDGLTFRDHINTAMTGTSGKTRSDVLASVQALLNYAVKEKGWIEANPWAGTAIPKGRAQKRETWDNDALETLLTAPLTHDRRVDLAAQYWLPLLALMSGARQAELCQLRVADVIRRDGVWLLDINENDEGKSVKSAAGERWVAVHQKLIDLGFVEHVDRMRQAGESLVFPGILTSESRAASVYVSDWFRARCTSLGLYRRYRDFHALRTTVGTALRAVDPSLGEALITAVMGHEAGNAGAANYHRPAPKTLRRVIAHLDFPSVLSLPRVHPAPT